MWSVVKRQKRGFAARKQHLVVDGTPIPWTHLQDTQWADRTTPEQLAEIGGRPDLRPQRTSQGPVTLEELQQAITRMKSHKAPGPDEAPAELFKWLDSHGEAALLDIFQEVWNKGTIPQDWKHALVVTIYKGKGLDTDPSNYRPISLLNSMYKLFASIIQTRFGQ